MERFLTQAQHDRMVAALANDIASRGFTDVRADLQGWTRPEIITWQQTGKGHIPDVTGVTGGALAIFEVETADSIADQHTADQWSLFAAYAAQYGAEFWVVTPFGSAAAAQQRLKELGLTAKIGEI